jgi:hypothetical protein
MKTFFFVISCCLFLFGYADVVLQPAGAQEYSGAPTVSLTVQEEPLGNILMIITNQTGVDFKLNDEWGNHLVSAEFENLSLEKGLNRLLKSLNHTIVWESEKSATIMVYGKAEPGKRGGVSFAPPPRPEEPPVEVEPEMVPEPELEPAESGKEATPEVNLKEKELVGS